MRIISATFLATAIVAAASPVLAADLAMVHEEVPTVEPVAAPGFDWSGLSIGVHAGEVFHGLDYNDDFAFDPAQDFNWQQRGGEFGLSIGYDTALTSRVIAGAELRYDYFNTDFTPYIDGIGGTLVTIDDAVSLTGRLGYLFTPDTLVYVRAGIASTGVSVPIDFPSFHIESGRATGGIIGVGAETRLFDNLSANVEARYFKSSSSWLNENELEYYPKFFSVTAGLKYRFDETGSGTPDGAFDVVDYDFTGAYASISAVGAASGMLRDITITPGADDGPFWDDAFGAGVGLGFDAAIGGDWRIGAELTADYLGLVYVDPDQNSPDVGSDTRFATVDGIIALTARLGAKINASTLLYGKVGVAGLYTTANEDFFADRGGGEEELLPGYQIGLGIETAVTDNMTIGVEGLYTAATESLVTDNLQIDQVALKPEVLTGKVSLKFHF